MTDVFEYNAERIRQLYSQGHSMRQLAEMYSVSLNAMVYFFRKHNISRRSASENNRLIYERSPTSFCVKNRLSSEEKLLKIAGVMLYWGEGSKWDGEKIVDFANSNEKMVQLFVKFLRCICGVEEKKLRVFVYCYADQQPEALMKYWSSLTNIPLAQFTKPYIRKDFKKEKSGKMKFGLVHIRYGDKRLLELIKDWIKEYSVQFIGSVPERSNGADCQKAALDGNVEVNFPG